MAISIPPLSRLNNQPSYVDKAGNVFFGPWKPFNFAQRTDDILYTLDYTDGFRPDSIAYAVYGTSNLWWVVCQAAGCLNPLDGLLQPDLPASTPVLLGVDGRPCLKITSKSFGDHLDSGKPWGLTIRIRPGSDEGLKTVDVYLGANPSLIKASDYPGCPIPEETVVDASSVFADDTFWPYAKSRFVNFVWMRDPREVSPAVPKDGVYKMWGGKSNRSRTIRLPSRAQINQVLT